MADTKYVPTLAVIPARFAPGVQARNRETLEQWHIQMVLEDRAEFAGAPLHLLEPEGSA